MTAKTLSFTLHDEHDKYYYDRPETFEYIVPTCEIEDCVILSDDKYLKFPNLPITQENLGALTSLLPTNQRLDVGWYEDVSCSLSDYEHEQANDVEPVEPDMILWNADIGVFTLSDCDSYPSYEYWDGSNWVRIWPEDMTQITIDDDYEDLDSYDQNGNKFFNEQWTHGKLYPVITIDGEEVSDMYLLYISSQWQGSRDVARLIDADERLDLVVDAETVCAKLDITVDELNELCGGLGGNEVLDMLVRKHGLDLEYGDVLGDKLAEKGILTDDEGVWLDKS